ncbi:MAG: NnrU family protein [Hyphomicrobiales bacterium]|nr:NnrU family protein [Hyphomicrobiales bacterium]
MIYLILGLVAFFPIHLLTMLAPQWREARIASMGENKWKGIYSVASTIGFVLIVWGYSLARPDATELFTPPSWAPHLVIGLMAIAFILMMAGSLPAGRTKQAVKHPFVLSIMIWAFAHLLANGDLASAILFGSFLIYAVWNRINLKHRDVGEPVAVSSTSDLIAIISGLAIWVIVLFWLHEWAIGVIPIA